MANIIIGHKNYLFDSGVTLTEGDQHADFPAENLLLKHPEPKWRADDLTASYMQIDLGSPRPVDLVVPLYSTGTRRRQLLKETDDIKDSSEWTKTNVTVTQNGAFVFTSFPPNDVSMNGITASGTGEHEISQTVNIFAGVNSFMDSNDGVAVSSQVFYLSSVGGTAKIELEVTFSAGGKTASIEMDPVTGTVTTENASFLSSVTDSGVESLGDDWYRAYFSAALAPGYAAGAGDLVTTLYVLDSSYTRSYTAGSESVSINGIKTALGGQINYHERNSTNDPGASWYLKGHNSAITPTSTDYSTILQPRSLSASDFVPAGTAWTHGVPWAPASKWFLQHWLVELHDNANADARIDLSNLFLGTYWQPTKNLVGLSIRPSKTREWTIDLGFLTHEDAWHEAHALGLKDRLTDGLSVSRSYSGVEYVADLNPILVILDHEDQEFGQAMTIYGRLTSFEIGPNQHYADRGDSTAGAKYLVTFTIRELIPG